MTERTTLTRSFLTCCVLLGAITTSAPAQTQTWFNGGATDDWDLATFNWDAGAALWGNAVTSDAVFGTAGETVTVAVPGVQVNDMSFGVTGYDITGGNTLTLVGATPTITVTTAGHIATISAPLAGSAGLTKAGAGILVLSGANTYTGLTRVGEPFVGAAGTLRLGASDVIPDASGVQIAPNSTLDMAGFSDRFANLFMAGTASTITNTGVGGALTINGFVALNARNNTGVISTGTGKVVLGDPSAYIEHLRRDRNSRIFTVNGNLDLNESRAPWRVIRVDGDNTLSLLTASIGDLTMNAIVADGDSPAGILKTNSGQLSLNAANTYTGGTIITEGVIALNAAGRLGANVVGNDVRVEGGSLHLAAAANIGANQTLTVNSNGTRLGMLGLAFNGLPTFTTNTSGVLAVNTTGYTAVTNMATLGNGQWFLGSSASTSTFTAASLAPATDNVYRLGGGQFSFTGFGGVLAPSNVLTVTNGVLVDSGGDQRSLLVGIDNTYHGGIVVNLQGNNTYTGSTTIDAGVLRLSGANGAISGSQDITINGVNASNRLLMDHRLELDSSGVVGNNNNNRIHNSATVTMNSGDFRLRGNNSVSTTEVYDTLALNSGFAKVTIDPAAGGTATLAGASLTRANNATVVFRGQNMGAAPAASVSNVTFTNAPTLIGGALGGTNAGIIPWALVDDVNTTSSFNTDPDPSGNNFATDFGDSFATYGTNGIRSLQAGEFSGTFTAGDNIRLTSAQTPGAGTLTVNSFHVDAGGSVTGANATNLVVTSGGILNTTTAATSITAAQIASYTAGDGSSPAELIIHAPNAAPTASNITLAGVIQDNSGQKVGVTVSGSNAVIFTNNANTYTGKTVVYGNLHFHTIGNVGGGNTSLGNPQNAADGTIALAGDLRLLNSAPAGSQSTNRNIELFGSSSISNVKDSVTLTLNGNITGLNQNLFLQAAGNATTAITVGGTINLGDGILSTRGIINFNSTGHTFRTLIANIGSNTINLGVDNALPTNVALELSGTGSASATFNLNGHNQTIGNLSDNTGDGSNTGDVTTLPFRTLTNTAGSGTLTVNNFYTNTWGGTISGAGFSLTKGNDGMLVLYGSNTYGGNTTVNGGRLMVNTSLANNGSNKVFVAPDADGVFTDVSPTISRATKVGDSYAGFGSAVTAGLLTRADILAGENTTGNDAYTTMQWRLRQTDSGADGVLVSEILNLTDMNNSTLSSQTDVFVLQMNYDETLVGGPTKETEAVANGRLYLAWLNGGVWVNAVDGNFGNNASLAQQNYLGSFAAFQLDYGTSLSSYIGAWGVDTALNHAWAVVNHNSQFAVLIPEPGTMLLLATGAALVVRRRRND